MKTMTDNRYVPTWERKYDKWETEPDTTLDFGFDEEESEPDEISIEEIDEKDLLLEMLEELDEEGINDIE